MTAPSGDPPSTAKPQRGPRKLHDPPPPDKRELFDRHLADLKKSGLHDDTIKAAGLYSEHRPLALTEILGRTYSSQQGAALVIPFHLPGESNAYAFRVKPDKPRLGKPNRKGIRKPIKYDQSSDAGLLVYLPPWARETGALKDVTRTLYFTEGEKKSLAFDELRLPCVGLTGVNSYVADKSEQPANDNAPERLHRTIREHVAIAGRHCVICYDADAHTNPQVMLAAGKLCGVLKLAGAISVRFITPPSLEHKGFDDYYAAHGEEPTRQLLDAAADIDPINPMDPAQRVRALKPMLDAPIPDDIRLPLGYSIENDSSLWKLASDDKHSDVSVSRGPILIQRYLDDYYQHDVRVQICFQREGRWIEKTVVRAEIVDSRSMVARLSQFGAPVTSNNASRLVDFIDDLERVNVGRVPRIACVERCGWHTIDGVRTFVTNEPLFADGDSVELAVDTRKGESYFAALRPSSNFAAHRDALREAFFSDPICAAMICSALAAPLLEPLRCPNFAVHLPGDSSRGKTTLLKIAGSVFGQPNDENYVASWNTTQNAAETRATIYNDLPLLFDEVGASDRMATDKLVYMLINGTGKVRAYRDLSTRPMQSWRTVVLSTGERGLAEETAASGAQVRVLQLPVSGIGTLDALAVDRLRDACAAHAGAFGRQWLQMLLECKDWQPFREMYATQKASLTKLSKNTMQARAAAYWAMLATAEMMSAGLGLGKHGASTVLGLFKLLQKGEQLRPASERARQHVEEWIHIEPRAFPELRASTGGDDTPKGNAHHTVHGYLRSDGAIVFWPSQLRAELEKNNFSYESVCREWRQRGWLDTNDDRFQKVVTIGGVSKRMVVLLPLSAAVVPPPAVSEAVGQ